ncbi:MAG: acyltransferase family protein, partial [Alphaproteobacteria bacterium]
MSNQPQTATAAAFASGKLYGLQYLRGVGVMIVAAHHCTAYVSLYSPMQLPDAVFDIGLRHLHLFFVVSGLLMMMIHWHEAPNIRNWRVFHLKRHFRIFPLVFLVVTAGAVGAWLKATAGMGGETLSFGQYLNSMLIYPMQEPTKPGVMWTLRNELIFYLLFSLMFINRKAMLVVLLIWVVASLFLGERTFERVGSNKTFSA